MILGMVSIGVVVAVTLLVALGALKEKYYPYGIALMAAGLVYAITLLGTYVVGSDIQGELAASRESLTSGWNFTTATSGNAITGINLTSVVTGLIAPALSRMLRLDIVWVYKAVLPLFLVAVPVILYFAFRKQIGAKRAFFATLFFIIMPVYSLQLAQIVKSMVAEMFFALMILAMVSDWSWQRKVVAMTACVILASASHYTIGIAMLAYLIGIATVRTVTALHKNGLWRARRVPIAALAAILIVSSGAFYVYYHYAYGGAVNQVLSGVIRWHGNAVAEYAEKAAESAVSGAVPPPVPPTVTATTTTAATTVTTAPPASRSYLYNQEYTVQVGIGLDFFSQPIEGKLFRITQYLTQLLIIIGAFRLLFRYRAYRLTAEFIAGVGCSFVLLLTCIFVPQFSSIINMPRFYQLSLFFLAPMLVLGCDALSNFYPRKRQEAK